MGYWRAILILVLSVFLLWRNLPSAILCLFPRLLRAKSGDESWPKIDSELFDQMEQELAPLGFKRLGVHVELPPLRRGIISYDFVHEPMATWASAYVRGSEVDLLLLSPFEKAFVLTADHRRPSTDIEGSCLAGGIPGAEPEQLLAAHRRRVERMKASGQRALADLSLEARVNAANRWCSTHGARELRLRYVNSLFLCIMGVAFLAVLIISAYRSYYFGMLGL